MEKYLVSGMSCAACQNRVEKAVSSVDGVSSCTVSLLTNSMQVEGTASSDKIIEAVRAAGYDAKSFNETSNSLTSQNNQEMLEDKETPKLKKRLFTSMGFLLILMYLSMGHHMFGLPLPGFLADNHLSNAITQMLLAIIVLVINRKFFVSGIKSLLSGYPNMDCLVALGSAAAFGYSLVELYMMSNAMMISDHQSLMKLAGNLYFETAAMIPTLITVGKMLEAKSKGKTTKALQGLMNLASKTAVLIRNGQEVEVDIEDVHINDVFVVRPGQTIPVDGIILEGSTSIDESTLTGESIPVDKNEGDTVSAATINQAGSFTARATRVGEDTTLSQIIKMVSDASSSKAPIARIADRVANVFVPIVIGISVITFIIWLLAGKEFGFAISRAIAVLVISCPCALGLATPVAIMVGNGVGAKNGILFKNAIALENAGKTEIIALDKTGTITSGKPMVTDVIVNSSDNREEFIRTACSLELNSEHPLARAVVEYANECGIEPEKVTGFAALSGNGIKAVLKDVQYYGGSYKFISSIIDIDGKVKDRIDELSEQGKTPLLFCNQDKLIGIIAVADQIKHDSVEAIKQIQALGINPVMLTGDNERTARALADKAGLKNVIAQVMPDGKQSVINKLKQQGRTAMVGDGINDAPALTSADLGVAIGAGSDIAIDAADIVLMKSTLMDVAGAVRLSRATIRNIYQNLFWAFFYNVICIPLAAGFYQELFGFDWQMSPMLGAACMSLSSLFVCTNALRLNLVDIYDEKRFCKELKEIEIIQEVKNMEKELIIEGMMCPHCEMTVKKALEAVNGVEEAVVSHVKGNAVVKLSEDVADEVLKGAVEAKDYQVKEIR